MVNARNAACGLYLASTVFFSVGLRLDSVEHPRPVRPLERALARGAVGDLPRLDPDDAMANAAVLTRVLDEVPYRDLGSDRRGGPCRAAPRSFAVLVGGRPSWVRFGSRAVCQLDVLKRVSGAQRGGFGEVGAFLIGRRLDGGKDVDVTRVVVPPFRFTVDTLSFMGADLGELEAGERLIGTYHTHPGTDLDQGALSEVDLRFMRYGYVDFHGKVGPLWAPDGALDWLFDIVDPQGGGWNVYAHDAERLGELSRRCDAGEGPSCPLNELRLAGSRYYLLTRYYEEEVSDFWAPR
jgi:proteasome lid subunit RPN8/RPN11